MKTGQFLREWRQKLGISERAVSDKTGIPVDRLSCIELGKTEVSVSELEFLSIALGLKSSDLLDDDIPASAAPEPLRVLMKSAEDFTPPDDVRLRIVDAARAALDLLELRRRLGAPRPAIPAFGPRSPVSKRNQPVHAEGSELAKSVRKHFRISGPIRSVRDLLTADLGVPVVGANLSSFGPDAFSVYAPNAGTAVVLNLRGKNENKLVARFSLLHELAHVLFDRPAQGSMGIACRVSSERDLRIEVRANAFAMRMLLPERELSKVKDDTGRVNDAVVVDATRASARAPVVGEMSEWPRAGGDRVTGDVWVRADSHEPPDLRRGDGRGHGNSDRGGMVGAGERKKRRRSGSEAEVTLERPRLRYDHDPR